MLMHSLNHVENVLYILDRLIMHGLMFAKLQSGAWCYMG